MTRARDLADHGDGDFSSIDSVKLPSGSSYPAGTRIAGELFYNIAAGQLEYFDGVNWVSTSEKSSYITATGGTITTVGNYKVHTFNTSGNFVVSLATGAGEVEYLIVGGGGAGHWDMGGGGGGGGFLTDKAYVTTGVTYSVIVGAGKAAPASALYGNFRGNYSSVFGIYAWGGGGGGTGASDASFNTAGGSGGGGGRLRTGYSINAIQAIIGSPGVDGQGNHGGAAARWDDTASWAGGGGGGGAGFPGTNVSTGNGPVGGAGPGGFGKVSSIIGSAVTYAGGGGGGGGYYGGSGGTGGGGGGGTTNYANGGTSGAPGNGTANLGGGGGGGGWGSTQTPAAGGSGIVIIRYRFQ